MKQYLPLLLLLALTIPGHSQQSQIEERLNKWLLQFPEADANGDGKLTLEEAQAYREKMTSGTNKRSKKKSTVEPTYTDVSYGPHDRNKLDLWIPEESSDGTPFPVLIYFHGGGFVVGDKGSFDPSIYLDAGIACISANYRFVDGIHNLGIHPLQDGARVVQTVRHHAEEWNLDPGRIALSGGSAGAVMAMWIAYKDDMADPTSDDPVSKESTRVNCVVPINGPTNLMPDWIQKNLGGPAHVHGSFAKMFGEGVSGSIPEPILALIREVSPWEHVSADDPPSFLVYSGPLDEVPLPETATTGKLIHHPYFGKALKEKLDELGVENEFRYGFDPRGTMSIPEFLMTHFGMID